jgi:hypothetical protein
MRALAGLAGEATQNWLICIWVRAGTHTFGSSDIVGREDGPFHGAVGMCGVLDLRDIQVPGWVPRQGKEAACAT